MSIDAVRVLLVEDDPALRDILRDYLEKDGFIVIESGNGSDALSLAESEKPEILLLDIILPVMSGFEVLEKVRANPEIGRTPCIFLTNLDSSENISRSISLGAVAYLIKSDYEPQDIVQRVRKVADASFARQIERNKSF